MTITIRLSPQEERTLTERAARSGQDLVGYFHRLIADDLGRSTVLDEALAPIRRQFEESAMTAEGLDTLVEEVREEVWREAKADPAEGMG